MGAEIKFIILEIDKISSKAVGSRVKAMERLQEINIKRVEIGDKVYGKIIGVWKKYIRIPGEKVIIKIYKIIPEKRKIYSSLIKIIGSDASE